MRARLKQVIIHTGAIYLKPISELTIEEVEARAKSAALRCHQIRKEFRDLGIFRIDDRIGEGIIPHLHYLGVQIIEPIYARLFLDEICNEMDDSDLDEELKYFVERYVYVNKLPRGNKRKFKFFKPENTNT